MAEPRAARPWDQKNVAAVCTTLGVIVGAATFAFMLDRCVAVEAVQEAHETERARVEPVRLKASLEGCHAACAPGQVRAWSSSECVCD